MNQTSDSEFNLLGLVHALREEWLAIVGFTVVAAIASVAIALISTPVYRAETVIMEVTDGQTGISGTSALLGQLSGFANIAGVDVGALGGARGNAAAILRSRTLVEKFVERHNVLRTIYADQWDNQNSTWQNEDTAPTLWQGVDRFENSVLTIRNDSESGLMIVSIDWTNPETAARWANDFVSLANQLARERDLKDAERNIDYLRTRIDETSVVELKQVMFRLMESELRTVMLANARDEYAFTTIDSAVVPERRIRPRRALIAVLGTMLGGILGLLVAATRQTIKRERLRAEAIA